METLTIIEKKFFKPSGSLSNSANLFYVFHYVIIQTDKALLHDLFVMVMPCFTMYLLTKI